MKKNVVLIVGIALVCCLFLDLGVFSMHNLFGMRPFVIIALVTVLGIALGGVRAGIIGASVGMLSDIFFSKYLGLGAATYLVCGMVSGIFFRKYYTDNVIFPAVLAAILTVFCELFYAIFMAIVGVSYNFFQVLFMYILPCSLMTGVLAIPLHLILRPALDQHGRFIAEKRDRII